MIHDMNHNKSETSNLISDVSESIQTNCDTIHETSETT